MITIICAECGIGHYVATGDMSRWTHAERVWADYQCTSCEHLITGADVTLDEGEVIHWDEAGRLAYTTERVERIAAEVAHGEAVQIAREEGYCAECGAEPGYPCGHLL